LVKLGHVALDGTKLKANASKHQVMSYERMCRKEKDLKAEVAPLLEEAERVDPQDAVSSRCVLCSAHSVALPPI
jgi:hypothetical protein